MKKASWFIILLLAVSCLDDPDCFQLNNNIIGISFRVLGSEKPDTLRLVGIEIPGADSIFHKLRLAVSVDLPLNFTASQSDINFLQVDDANSLYTNYLHLGYLAKTQYVSEDCGSRFILSDLEILEHNFDSVNVVNTWPDKVARENINVYRCPDPIYLTVVFRDLYLNSSGDEAKRTSGLKFSKITDSYSGNNYADTVARATYYLPVDTTKDETTFTFIQPNDTTNTLTVNYSRKYEKRYNTCDPQTFISDVSIVNSNFVLEEMVTDNEGNEKSTLTDPHEANIYLYRCQKTNLVKIDFKQRVSGTSNSLKADTVLLKSVKANYTAQVFYTNSRVTSIIVPVDETQNTTDIYLEYETRIDTLRLAYTRSAPSTLVTACGPQITFTELNLVEEVTGVRVIPTSNSLKFPPVTNIEITN